MKNKIMSILTIILFIGIICFSSTNSEELYRKNIDIHDNYEDYILHGTIVTMENKDAINPSGNVLIRNGLIEEIWGDNETPPIDIDGLPLIITDGYGS